MSSVDDIIAGIGLLLAVIGLVLFYYGIYKNSFPKPSNQDKKNTTRTEDPFD